MEGLKLQNFGLQLTNSADIANRQELIVHLELKRTSFSGFEAADIIVHYWHALE